MSDPTAREVSDDVPGTDGPGSHDPSRESAPPRSERPDDGASSVDHGDGTAPEPEGEGRKADAEGEDGGAEPRGSNGSSPSLVESTAPGDVKEPSRTGVRLRIFGRTDVGQVREHNEDNFIVADLTKGSRGLMEAERTQSVGERGALFGVCDGMGGAAAGEVASQLAVDIIYQRMLAGGTPADHDELAARLVLAIEAAGLRIFSEAKLDRTRRGMGTTSTIAALLDDHLFLGQVGDSRAYILRGERLVQVTRDQSLVNQLIEAGQLTEEEAETFEHNNIILQALGTAESVQVDLTCVVLKRGDVLLLCSDGLSGMVRNDEIREVLRTIEEPLEACRVLTERANQAGGHDNITVVVARFEGDSLEDPMREDIEGLKYTKYQLPEHLLAANSLPEPTRRVREVEERKVSQRPPAPRVHASGGDEGSAEEDEDDEHDEDDEDEGRPVSRSALSDEAIHLPTEGAPQWLVIMMIASAVACVFIAGYYLFR
ncbi:Stp1/IreP family PP2C-type Ser/Thr phosphatase [Chondromyces apiculatus]|nr:Stp1/IreP family PP2C-type Ser/Thr phosphatase [Chondromyces apiculatus]